MKDPPPVRPPRGFFRYGRALKSRFAAVLAVGEPGGYAQVLKIAIPLILSTASITVTLFVDRMFLAWYGKSSVAAAVPAGITYFTICSLFMGTAQYVNTLVAQHHGAGDLKGCSRSVWQGVFFAVGSAPVILACIPLGPALFAWSDHGPEVTALENQYFTLLMLGGPAFPFNAALSSFFSGRGKTDIVMWGNVLGNAANILLDYVLIFGVWGFPELGIKGAGIATAVTGFIPPLFWAVLFLSGYYRKKYDPRGEFRWDGRLMRMLLRYGFPAGAQLFLSVASFSAFVMLIGRLGEFELAITNIVLSIEMLSFLPMIGMSIATATLVGENIGRNRPDIAERSVKSALQLAMGYMGTMAFLFLTVPGFFLQVFQSESYSPAEFETVLETGTLMLRFVAVWSLFDTMYLVYSGALKGAGDTTFAMWAQIVLAWVFFVPPEYVIVEYLELGLIAAWSWALVYIIMLGSIFRLRFRSGRWKEIDMLKSEV